MRDLITPKMFLIISGVFIFIIVGIYIYFQSYDLIQGPVIRIETPVNGVSLDDSLVTIRGVAKNATFISLNDSPIFTDTEGVFEEQLLLPYGYTIITLRSEDRFGRHIKKELNLLYK